MTKKSSCNNAPAINLFEIESLCILLRYSLRNRLNVTSWSRLGSKGYMALNANKILVRLPLINFVVEYAALIRCGCYVTALGTAAGLNRHLQRFEVDRVHRHVVAFGATQLGVHFMTKRAG
jgi:hypothetical protein